MAFLRLVPCQALFFGVGKNDSRLVGRLLSVSQPECYELTQLEVPAHQPWKWSNAGYLSFLNVPCFPKPIHGEFHTILKIQARVVPQQSASLADVVVKIQSEQLDAGL